MGLAVCSTENLGGEVRLVRRMAESLIRDDGDLWCDESGVKAASSLKAELRDLSVTPRENVQERITERER